MDLDDPNNAKIKQPPCRSADSLMLLVDNAQPEESSSEFHHEGRIKRCAEG